MEKEKSCDANQQLMQEYDERPMRFRLAPPLVTSYSVEDYRDILKISEKELRGRTILDISSGRGAMVETLRREGFDVFGLDPIFSFAEEKREKFAADGKPVFKTNEIGGVNETLPLKDNSVEIILNNHGSIFYAPINYRNSRDMKAALTNSLGEMSRALAPGGEAHIASLGHIPRKIIEEAFGAIDRKYDISWEYFNAPRIGDSETIPALGLILRKH